MYGVKSGAECWETEGTENCSGYLYDAIKLSPNKLEACRLCLYYKEKHPNG